MCSMVIESPTCRWLAKIRGVGYLRAERCYESTAPDAIWRPPHADGTSVPVSNNFVFHSLRKYAHELPTDETRKEGAVRQIARQI